MSNPRQLLKAAELLPDESVLSIAVRLATICLTTVNEFLRYGLGLVTRLSSLPADRRALWSLQELGGYGSEEIQSRKAEWTKAGYIIYRREVPYHWICTNTRRVAPGVLFSDGLTPFHRLHWQVNALECDLDTGEALIELCPHCCVSLTWNNIESVAMCGVCGFDVRQQRPDYVSNSRLHLARELNAFLQRSAPRLPTPFCQVDDITACLAMEWFGVLADLPTGQSLNASCHNAGAGLPAVQSWPRSFDEILIQYRTIRSVPLVHDGTTAKGRLRSLIGAMEQAGTPILRSILFEHAVEVLGRPCISPLPI